MTLTFGLDLDSFKLNQLTGYLLQTSFRSEVIARAHTQAHTHTGPIAQ